MAEQTRSIGPIILPAGRAETPALSVNRDMRHIRCIMDGSLHLNPLTEVTVALEISYDDGATWRLTASTTRPGGPAFGDGGAPVTDFELTTDFDQSTSTRRRMKMSVTSASGSFTTAGGSLVASDVPLLPRTVGEVTRIPIEKEQK